METSLDLFIRITAQKEPFTDMNLESLALKYCTAEFIDNGVNYPMHETYFYIDKFNNQYKFDYVKKLYHLVEGVKFGLD